MGHRPPQMKWARTIVLAIFSGALIVSALFDRSAEGAWRLTFFRAALLLADPYVWEALVNSVGIALLVACVALALGIPLGWVLARWRPVGSQALLAAFSLLSVLTPLGLAVGLSMMSLDLSRFFERLGMPATWADRPQWFQLFWAEESWALAWVVTVCAASLRRLDPSWEDSARLSGATTRQIAISLIWPHIRPALMRAGGLIVLAVMFEPGGPLVLGTRRTLAYQILESATRENAAGICSALTILGLLGAMVIQATFRLLGGPVGSTEFVGETSRHRPKQLALRLIFLPPIVLVLCVGWLPILNLLRLNFPFGPNGLSHFRGFLNRFPSSGDWLVSILWTLAMAAVATVFARLALRFMTGLGRATGHSARNCPTPADGLPPSFLCALLILAMARIWGLLGSIGFPEFHVGGNLSWLSPLIGYSDGFSPILLFGSSALTLILCRVESLWSWSGGVRERESEPYSAAERFQEHARSTRRPWREDFGLCATVGGPALLFGTTGGSIAVALAEGASGPESTQHVAMLCLVFVGLSIWSRGRRDFRVL